MIIKNITDNTFERYGKTIKGIDCSDIIEIVNKTTTIPSNVIYVASDSKLEMCISASILERNVYGGTPIQIGYCNGNNYILNAVEYHKSSEINIAAKDLILIVGMQQDIDEDYKYDTSKMEAFFVPEGTIVELYATTLHFAPCNANEKGFRCVVVLPKGTNSNIKISPLGNSEDFLLAAQNKWLIAHPSLKLEGIYKGLKGDILHI